jgi:hypothetical protein
MKNTLREVADDNLSWLNVKTGQYLFYKKSRIFGKVTSVDEHALSVSWATSYGDRNSEYHWCNMAELGSELLDYCILCENEMDILFVKLKYGVRVHEIKN